MFLKWSKRIGLGLLCLIASLLISGVFYQFISTKIDKSKYPPPGQMVDIGGYRLHLHSMGTDGPTVVLDAGLGCISTDWVLVQPEIAKFARVISYDRAGTGWSDKGTNPRTSAQIVKELHALLHAAKAPEPYILVGHSFGGSNVQLFAATFPKEVLGLVLVDSCHEDQERKLPSSPLDDQIEFMHNPIVLRLTAMLGLTRLISNIYFKDMTPSFPRSTWSMRSALCSTVKHCGAVSAEASLCSQSFSQLEAANQSSLADKPCIVLTAGKLPDFSPLKMPETYRQDFFMAWNGLQKELVAKFRDGHQIIADKSDHMIPWHQPEVIVEAVQKLIYGSLNNRDIESAQQS